jgi:tRNA pseudouridine38-40 synthase
MSTPDRLALDFTVDSTDVGCSVEIERQPVARYRAVVAYNGAKFAGIAINADVRTVAGEITRIVSQVAQFPVELAVAGRTDAGVHAHGQVISFDGPLDLDVRRVTKSVNSQMSGEVVISQLQVAPDQEFHARFSAQWRRYRYTIDTGDAPDPLQSHQRWWVRWPLDIDVMRLACDPLIGEHDFSALCRRPSNPDATMMRRVHEAKWSALTDTTWAFDIRANAFCQQMVRSIVGLCVDVGRGHFSAGQVRSIVRSKDRANTGTLAPAKGLVLEEVGYADGYGASTTT